MEHIRIKTFKMITNIRLRRRCLKNFLITFLHSYVGQQWFETTNSIELRNRFYVVMSVNNKKRLFLITDRVGHLPYRNTGYAWSYFKIRKGIPKNHRNLLEIFDLCAYLIYLCTKVNCERTDDRIKFTFFTYIFVNTVSRLKLFFNSCTLSFGRKCKHHSHQALKLFFLLR